ncbi:hypothetical protein M0R72_05820 [Candidatus Pacearchaeota archaeon]|jgi:hypothetical protein|nr:hypothetical protein [Candidatus Pacearchaeota archaeon]
MFKLDAMKKDMALRYLDLLSSDVTVKASDIETITNLINSGTEVGLDEAIRLGSELIHTMEESGLCPMRVYYVKAGDMVNEAIQDISAKSPDTTSTNAKAIMEQLASRTPTEVREPFVLGMFIGRFLAEAEFEEVQVMAMKRAQDMLGGTIMKNVLDAVGDPMALLNKLRPPKNGEENDN